MPARTIMSLTAALISALAPGDRDVLAGVLDVLTPPDRSPPSVIAERVVELTSAQAARVGKISSDFLPFTRDAQDILYFEPHKLGTIAIKHAQCGWTQLVLNEIASRQSVNPGPALVLSPSDTKAKEYCYDRFRPIVEQSGVLCDLVEEAQRSKSGRKQLSIGYAIRFPGGKVTFSWASSETSVIGSPFRDVYIDDAEACLDEYPTGKGDLFVSAETRTRTYRGGGGRRLCINGHPRLLHEGLHLLYETKSDCRIWSIDCPGCRGVFPMHWDHVRHRSIGDDGRPDPRTAELRCPHCARVLSDAERARELWPSRERRRTLYGDLVPELRVYGSGRFESQLDDQERRQREYIGLQVTILCDPDVTVAGVARKLHAAGDDAARRMDILNKEIGVASPKHGDVEGSLGDALLDELVVTSDRDARDGMLVVPEDVEFLTGGVDVQKGPSGEFGPPGLYVVLVGWARSGIGYVCDARTGVGFDWLLGTYLPTARVRRAVSSEILSLGGSWCGIDAAWETTRVLEACRQRVYSTHIGAMVRLMAIRYDPRAVDAARTITEAPERKRTHPTRPELGLVEYYFAHRHSWVDRTHRRIVEKRLRMLCPEPEVWRTHLCACFLSPIKKQHDWEPTRLEWDKPKQVRDDYARCLDYAEITASVKMGLDSIHLRGSGLGAPLMGFTFGKAVAADQDDWGYGAEA